MKHLVLVVILLCASIARAQEVGFQFGRAPDGGEAPLDVAIWYPSGAAATEMSIGPFHQRVAMEGAIQGDRLPLILISHGTGGSSLGHYDTAIALAKAGFVVVSMSHTGDNYKDDSLAFTARNFANRPRHVSRVIDFMLSSWREHERLNPARIGIFGHSAGGATALILLGARPDLGRIAGFCRDNPNDWGCTKARERGSPRMDLATIEAADPRIKAAVVAAPALGNSFTAEALAGVKMPVQLWIAARDTIVGESAMIGPRLPVAPEFHLVPNAGHFSFLAVCGPELAKIAPEICADPEGFDRGRFLEGFQADVVGFFRARLR